MKKGFTRKIGICLFVFVFLQGGMNCFAQTESITITTYYPSPYGVYRQLTLSPTDVIDPGAALCQQRDDVL